MQFRNIFSIIYSFFSICRMELKGKYNYIKGKSLRFGYKVWCLNEPEGYLINFEVYQGRNPRINPGFDKPFGKCVSPLLQMIHEFPDHIKELSSSFYFDNHSCARIFEVHRPLYNRHDSRNAHSTQLPTANK